MNALSTLERHVMAALVIGIDLPGSHMLLERFDKYFVPGKPYADKIDIMVMGEAAARDVAFRNKEIDVSILGPAQYLAYQADPGLKDHILEVPEMYTRVMGMNQSFKPSATSACARRSTMRLIVRRSSSC